MAFLLCASFALDLGVRAVEAVSVCPTVDHPGQTPDPVLVRRIGAALLQPPDAAALAEALHATGYPAMEEAGLAAADLPGYERPKDIVTVTAGDAQPERGARAVLFAMASALADRPARRTIRFVWGGNRVPRPEPSEMTVWLEGMGDPVVGEVVAPIGWLYRDGGVKVAFVGDGARRGLVNVLTSRFRYHSDVPSVCEKRDEVAPWALPVAPRARREAADVYVIDWSHGAVPAESRRPERLAKIAYGLAESIRDIADYAGDL